MSTGGNKRIAAEDRERKRREREDAFLDSFDKREFARVKSATSAKGKRPDDRARVKAIIERDRRERARQMSRDLAELEVREGVYVNLSDTVVEPTEEWLARGEWERYTPRQPDGTVREIATVRRIQVPLVMRMAKRGQIGDEAAFACLWYAETYERAGLRGLIPSVNMAREIFAAPSDRTAFTDKQIEAQDEWRFAREIIPVRFRRFFDAVVLNDIPIGRSCRFAQMGKPRALAKFRSLAEVMIDRREQTKGVA